MKFTPLTTYKHFQSTHFFYGYVLKFTFFPHRSWKYKVTRKCDLYGSLHSLSHCPAFLSMAAVVPYVCKKLLKHCINCLVTSHSTGKCDSHSSSHRCTLRYHTLLHRRKLARIDKLEMLATWILYIFRSDSWSLLNFLPAKISRRDRRSFRAYLKAGVKWLLLLYLNPSRENYRKQRKKMNNLITYYSKLDWKDDTEVYCLESSIGEMCRWMLLQ